MSTIIVSGAYGRDYKSKAQALEAWNSGADFTIRSLGHHSYCNREDAERGGIYRVEIRYDADRKLVIARHDPALGAWR